MQDARALVTPRPWLILPIETNVRELQARTLLAAVAAERGFGTVIGRLGEIGHYLRGFPPSLILLSNVFGTDITNLAKSLGHVTTALDEEGLVLRDPDDYLNRRISVEALSACERFFAWGEVHRALVSSKAPGAEQQIIPVGNPRIDLLRPEVRGIYRSATLELTQRYGRFVLLNTNFGTFNHYLGGGHRAREWAALGWNSTAKGADLLHRTIEFQRNMFAEFVELVDALRQALPRDVRIVLRPHPSERQESYRERLDHLDAVEVIHEGSAAPWLLAADALVHNSCTTGIESALLGRPTFAYMPLRDTAVECSLPNQVSHVVESKDAMIAAVVSTVNRRWPAAETSSVLAHHIANLTGPMACEAIVDQLLTVKAPPTALKARSLPARVHVGRFALAARSFASAARRNNFSAQRKHEAFIRHASPHINAAEVQQNLKDLAAATGRFEHVACATLASNLVLISAQRNTDHGGSNSVERTTV